MRKIQVCVEKAVSSNIIEEIKLTDVEQELFEEESAIILCDNPAELSFVSGTLLTSSISHSILIDSSLQLVLIEEYEKSNSNRQSGSRN